MLHGNHPIFIQKILLPVDKIGGSTKYFHAGISISVVGYMENMYRVTIDPCVKYNNTFCNTFYAIHVPKMYTPITYI